MLAPMDGITDAPMRALQGDLGAFDYAVTEFIRVSGEVLPAKVFRRDVPELANECRTPTGMPVQVQLLGGDAGRMAETARVAVSAGARAIDLNFGCPAPIVNRHDGGASLLRSPCRIREVVAAVRAAVPSEIPVSAKMRLGWDRIDAIHENAQMAADGGASWITIHARTRVQGYQPPIFYEPIRQVREALSIPVIANGDIWNLEDFRICREITGCKHFMLGRGALARPSLAFEIASELGMDRVPRHPLDWVCLMKLLEHWTAEVEGVADRFTVRLMKQWLKLAMRFGEFPQEAFDAVKEQNDLESFYRGLGTLDAWGYRHA